MADGSNRPVPRRLAIAGMAGNILEWYDFSIYGFFAPAIGEAFFPSHNPATSLIDAYGVFAAGFLMRPLGAVIFGRIGDRKGRELALTLSVLAMAIPTFLMGALPDYRQIGVVAPILVVVLRLIQGLSVGGEFTTSVVFMIEHAGSRRGVMGALGTSGAFAGVLLGSAVGALTAWLMPLDALMAWGWRLPFLGGIAIGVAGYFIRRELRNLEPAVHPAPTPLGDLIRAEWRRIGQISGLKILSAVGFYLMFVYTTTYLAEVVGLEKGRAMAINTIGMAVALIVLPIAGWASDRVGRKPLMLVAAAGLILFAMPLFRLLWHPALHVPLIGQVGFAIAIALFDGVAPTAAVEAFPADVRCSAVAISHNLTMALIGGTTPMVATWLIERSKNQMAPAHYLIGAAIVSAIFALTLKETARAPLKT